MDLPTDLVVAVSEAASEEGLMVVEVGEASHVEVADFKIEGGMAVGVEALATNLVASLEEVEVIALMVMAHLLQELPPVQEVASTDLIEETETVLQHQLVGMTRVVVVAHLMTGRLEDFEEVMTAMAHVEEEVAAIWNQSALETVVPIATGIETEDTVDDHAKRIRENEKETATDTTRILANCEDIRSTERQWVCCCGGFLEYSVFLPFITRGKRFPEAISTKVVLPSPYLPPTFTVLGRQKNVFGLIMVTRPPFNYLGMHLFMLALCRILHFPPCLICFGSAQVWH
jgi:hypothetical protein